CHLDPQVRERTDALDSLGNTTAATGKGFAIGSAALTALALLAAYVEEVRVGFDHWAERIENVAESDDLTNANVTVMRPGVVAYRPVGQATADAYLVYEPQNAYQRNRLGQIAPAQSQAGGTATVNLAELEERGLVTPVRRATMPDFVRFYDVSIMNPKVLVGMFMGVMLAFVFCAMTMKAVGRAAGSMV